MTKPIIRTHLIAGGQYHDIDYARADLLRRLGASPHVRTTVSHSYADLTPLDTARLLVTYTCNVVPRADAVARLRAFVEGGGRWLALHGTNSILAQNERGRWYAPEDDTGFMDLVGSQFAAHPPIAPYRVSVRAPDDPLVAGLGDFDVEGGDELYYMRLFGEAEVLLDAPATGPARGFVERDWSDDGRHPVLYRKKVGAGEIVYFTLGHRRGHYDMEPLLSYYDTVEKGAWEIAPFNLILDRCIAWGLADG